MKETQTLLSFSPGSPPDAQIYSNYFWGFLVHFILFSLEEKSLFCLVLNIFHTLNKRRRTWRRELAKADECHVLPVVVELSWHFVHYCKTVVISSRVSARTAWYVNVRSKFLCIVTVSGYLYLMFCKLRYSYAVHLMDQINDICNTC